MSLFKRLFNLNYKSDKKASRAKQSDQSSYYPSENLPLDEKFTHYFNNNGGKFLYCENMEEVLEALNNILIENDWQERNVLCFDEKLISRFGSFNFNYVKDNTATFFLTSCEALVSKNGSILLSSNQIKEKKLKELPTNFIVFATTSQFIESISEGLRKINNQRKNFIPSNITTIKDFETEKEKDFMSYGSSTKNLYLLLLEDL